MKQNPFLLYIVSGLILAPFLINYLFPEVYVMQTGCQSGRLIKYMVLDNMNPSARAFHAWVAAPGEPCRSGEYWDAQLVNDYHVSRFSVWYWQLKREPSLK